jgi:DNA-binding transcriptional ArsR family regulator
VPVVAETRLDALARVGRALADPTRCRLLVALLDGPAYPTELSQRLGLTRANTSNHLACLRACGLVVGDPEGRQVLYRLSNAQLAQALGHLSDVVLAVDTARPCLDDNTGGNHAICGPGPVVRVGR